MALTQKTERGDFRCLIAGGGVAALEAAIAIRELAPGLVGVELLAPEQHFWYRPLAVAEPFDAGHVVRFELGELAESIGAGFTLDSLVAVDPERDVAVTGHGTELGYDALVVACGAVPVAAVPGALTFRGPADTEAFRRLLGEIRAGDVDSVVFVLPPAAAWGLALYELALLTATYLERQGIRSVDLTLVTHEPAPLALFGGEATEAVGRILDEKGIEVLAETYVEAQEPGFLRLTPGGEIPADRIVALPRLAGHPIAGLPADRDGFLVTDSSGRVAGLENVFAAGDGTAFPVKQGGIAAQQADAVAQSVVAAAGADIEPQPFRPVLQGLLLTGGAAAYMRSELGGGHGETATVSGDALWWPPAKIVGRHLAPFLARRAEIELPSPPDTEAVPVDVVLG